MIPRTRVMRIQIRPLGYDEGLRDYNERLRNYRLRSIHDGRQTLQTLKRIRQPLHN
jgi:hypothetical protein